MAQKYIRIGHQEAHEKLTARLFWRKVGDTGYNDAGNVKEFADASTRSLVTRARAEDGARYVNDVQPDICHEKYTFLLDERNPAQEELLKLAKIQTEGAQTFLEAATASLTDVVKGKWYPIGSYNIANVRVTGTTSGEISEGSDYEIDTYNGRIRLLEDGSVAEKDDLTVTFDRPAMQFERVKTQQQSLFRCDVIIEEKNAFHKMWLRRAAATGYLNVIEFPNHTGDFATYRVEFTPEAAMTWDKRPEQATIPEAPATTEGPGLSSSSSSSSSASQSSSSSSSGDTA